MFFRRLLVATLLLIFTATAASAYTVVMRNGRRVEIPNTFTLTKSTLTYETAPGIQITIQLAGVDIAATERLNGQTPGSFLAAAVEAKAPAEAVQTPRTAVARSITNKDLETYRRARIESERERQELGLPSAEERRREVEEIDDRTQQQIRDMRSREELEFWRQRATSLEAQMSATAAQTQNVPQMYDTPWAYPYGVGLVTTGFPFGFDGVGFRGSNRFGFNRFGFPNFGFNRFGFNNFNSHFPRGNFRGRLLFTLPKGTPGRGGFRGRR
jgi:hypothetical protein